MPELINKNEKIQDIAVIVKEKYLTNNLLYPK